MKNEMEDKIVVAYDEDSYKSKHFRLKSLWALLRFIIRHKRWVIASYDEIENDPECDWTCSIYYSGLSVSGAAEVVRILADQMQGSESLVKKANEIISSSQS